MFRSSISFRLGSYFGLWFISSSSINSSLDATRTVRVAVNRRIATAGSLSARRWLFVSADGIIGMRQVLRPWNRSILPCHITARQHCTRFRPGADFSFILGMLPKLTALIPPFGFLIIPVYAFASGRAVSASVFNRRFRQRP